MVYVPSLSIHSRMVKLRAPLLIVAVDAHGRQVAVKTINTTTKIISDCSGVPNS